MTSWSRSWCTSKCQKWTIFSFGCFFIVVAIVLLGFWNMIIDAVKSKQLNLASDDTIEYNMWKETPIPMYIEFYLFNWTNAEDVVKSNWKTKPSFEEKGPYTFEEKHYRKNVVFNDNHTLTYKTQRIWHFASEKTQGSLDDSITTINAILLTMGQIVREKHEIVKMGVNFILEQQNTSLLVTKSAREFIFDGFDDPLLDLLKKLHLRHINIPFSRFGWFVDRNGSIEYDGVYNMYDGSDNVRKMGRFTAWNYETHSKYYSGECGKIKGTSGELWYPVQEDLSIEVFSPDLCSSLVLERNGNDKLHGVEGHKFVGVESAFDNGTKYPEMACYNPGEVLRSGVRNVSECKFNAPAFVSYPHFYLADPHYRESIEGMNPDPAKHQFFVSLEPETGIPIQAYVSAQVNLRVQVIPKIKIFENVKEHLIPALWFKEYVQLDEDLASQARLLLMLPAIGEYTGYAACGLGCLLLIAFGIMEWRKRMLKREKI